jgi:hypothetical protein
MYPPYTSTRKGHLNPVGSIVATACMHTVHPGLAPDYSALVAKGFPFAVGRIGGSGCAAAVAQHVKCRGEYNVRC